MIRIESKEISKGHAGISLEAKKADGVEVLQLAIRGIAGLVRVFMKENDVSQELAEALGKALASDVFESYSAGTETRPQINQDAVRLMKAIYGIDMEQTQYSKLISDIPEPDIAISMGCNVGCPFIGRPFDDNWELEDPTGKSDEEFEKVIDEIRVRIMELKQRLGKNIEA